MDLSKSEYSELVLTPKESCFFATAPLVFRSKVYIIPIIGTKKNCVACIYSVTLLMINCPLHYPMKSQGEISVVFIFLSP